MEYKKLNGSANYRLMVFLTISQLLFRLLDILRS
jgi:hypothetical protein